MSRSVTALLTEEADKALSCAGQSARTVDTDFLLLFCEPLNSSKGSIFWLPCGIISTTLESSTSGPKRHFVIDSTIVECLLIGSSDSKGTTADASSKILSPSSNSKASCSKRSSNFEIVPFSGSPSRLDCSNFSFPRDS